MTNIQTDHKYTLLKERLMDFSISVIVLTRNLPNTPENIIIVKQIIRSATSIGANYAEAFYAYSLIDFIHVINISRKETNETLYWLELLLRANPSKKELIAPILEEGTSILRIFIASVKTARTNLENKKTK